MSTLDLLFECELRLTRGLTYKLLYNNIYFICTYKPRRPLCLHAIALNRHVREHCMFCSGRALTWNLLCRM